MHIFPQAIAEHNLPKLYFHRLVQARERPSNAIFSNKADLEQFVEQSTSSIYYLLLKIVGVENLNADHAVSHLGKAQGICNMLRALAIPDMKTRSIHALPVIPQDVLLNYRCSYERVLRQQPNDEDVQNCVFEVASVANSHLEKARQLSEKIPVQAKPLFLPALAIGRFLERLRHANFNLGDGRFGRRDGLLPIIYYWNYLRKKY